MDYNYITLKEYFRKWMEKYNLDEFQKKNVCLKISELVLPVWESYFISIENEYNTKEELGNKPRKALEAAKKYFDGIIDKDEALQYQIITGTDTNDYKAAWACIGFTYLLIVQPSDSPNFKMPKLEHVIERIIDLGISATVINPTNDRNINPQNTSQVSRKKLVELFDDFVKIKK